MGLPFRTPLIVASLSQSGGVRIHSQNADWAKSPPLVYDPHLMGNAPPAICGAASRRFVFFLLLLVVIVDFFKNSSSNSNNMVRRRFKKCQTWAISLLDGWF